MDYKLYRADEPPRAELMRIIAETLAARDDIGFAYLFGSFVDGSSSFRDIDVSVYFMGSDTRRNIQEGIELSVELTSKKASPIVVRPLNDAPANIVYMCMRVEMLDNSEDDLRCSVTEQTHSEYFDIQPILQRALKEAYSS